MKALKTWVGAVVASAAIALAFLGCEGDYARPEDPVKLTDLDRPDCRVGVFLGYSGEVAARRFFPQARIVGFEEVGDAAAELLAGKIEAFVSDEHILNVALRAYPDRLRVLDDVLDRSPAVVAASAKRKDLLSRINAYIAAYRRNGTYDGMYLRWCACDRYTPMPTIEPATNATEELKIGTSGLLEPSSFIDENGDLTGFDIEFGRRLAKSLGLRPRFVMRPDSTFENELRSGAVDIVLDDYDDIVPRKGIAYSDGYLDADLRVLVACDDPSHAAKTRERMLDQTRIGMTDVLIGDTRLRLMINGFFNTVSITVLVTLFGLVLACAVRRVERRLPRALAGAVDWSLKALQRLPPILLILFFNGAVLPFAWPWLTIVVALTVWFASFLEPTADAPAGVVLPVLRLRVPILLQWTAVAGAVDVFDLTMAADLVCGRSFEALLPLVAVGAAYIVLAWVFDFVLARIERACA